MKTIYLHGRLKEQFGPEYAFDVASPAEAIRALFQLEGFEEALKEGEYRVSKVYDGHEVNIDGDEVPMYFGNATGLRIEPIVGGAKKGAGKLILGIILVGLAFWGAPALVGAGASQTTILGISAARIGQMGAMIALQGAASLLTPTPQAPDPSDQEGSYLLDATGNLIEQGNPVPIVFGECFVGSVMISAGLTAEEIEVVPEADDDPVTEATYDPSVFDEWPEYLGP